MLSVDTVYFHIGSIKTGSTAIQKFCFENRAALLAAGIDYTQFQPPQLHLPRWANADCFLMPEIDADLVRGKISASSVRSTHIYHPTRNPNLRARGNVIIATPTRH
jgi:hypothetical protein